MTVEKFSRWEAFNIWKAIDIHLRLYESANYLCRDDDTAFDILTKVAAQSDGSTMEELWRDITVCHIGPSTIVHVYKIADGSVERFMEYIADMYDGYSRCYDWRWYLGKIGWGVV